MFYDKSSQQELLINMNGAVEEQEGKQESRLSEKKPGGGTEIQKLKNSNLAAVVAEEEKSCKFIDVRMDWAGPASHRFTTF